MKKPKKAIPAGWICGCGLTQPHYILYCPRCMQGNPKG